MAMTKKHFEQFAAGIKGEIQNNGQAVRQGVCTAGDAEFVRLGLCKAAYAFVAVAKRDNAQFDARRFLEACGF